MTGLAQPVPGIIADQSVIGLLGRAVACIGVQAQIIVAVEGLRVIPCPGSDFIFVDKHIAIFDPGSEFRQFLIVGIFGNTEIEPVIPIVNAANQIVATYKSVGHEGTAMQTSAIENRRFIIHAHDYKIDLADQGIFGLTVI